MQFSTKIKAWKFNEFESLIEIDDLRQLQFYCK